MLNLSDYVEMYKACVKIEKVLKSCVTLEHLKITQNMIFNFGKMYGFNKFWSVLDTEVSERIRNLVDLQYYKYKLKTVEEN